MLSLSTLQKKQIVGVTGLAMVGFVIAHLSGNFLIFKGAEAFNGYADFLHSLGGLLWAARLGLIAAVILHMGFTINLVITNRKARGRRYNKYQNHRDEQSLSVRLMPISGTIIIVYIIVHLLDFTLADKVGVIEGIDYGLYGLVVNTLKNPWHSLLYIVSMIALGSHLSHAFQSIFQTLGTTNQQWIARLEKISLALGVFVSLGFISIPVFILLVL